MRRFIYQRALAYRHDDSHAIIEYKYSHDFRENIFGAIEATSADAWRAGRHECR